MKEDLKEVVWDEATGKGVAVLHRVISSDPLRIVTLSLDVETDGNRQKCWYQLDLMTRAKVSDEFKHKILRLRWVEMTDVAKAVLNWEERPE